MVLYLNKYSLFDKNPLQLNEMNYIISRRGRLTSSDKILYSTTESNLDSDAVNQSLSITYYPKFVSAIDVEQLNDFEMVDNLWRPLQMYNLKKALRVWPAFGKTGGSREIIIKSDTKNEIVPSRVTQLPNGGAVGSWHQDAVYLYDRVIAEGIARGIIDALEYSLREREHQENYSVKVFQQGLAVNVFLPNHKNITLSAAWRNLSVQPKFKFWACMWQDFEELDIRSMLKPYTESFIFPSVLYCEGNFAFFPKDQKNVLVPIISRCHPSRYFDPEKIIDVLHEDFELKTGSYEIVKSIIQSLMGKILTVDDEFFKAHRQDIDLPK